jgi:hypothetical protein
LKAYALEVGNDTTAILSFERLANINPELAKTVCLGIGILGGTAITTGTLKGLNDVKGVSVFSDLLGSNFYALKYKKFAF